MTLHHLIKDGDFRIRRHLHRRRRVVTHRETFASGGTCVESHHRATDRPLSSRRHLCRHRCLYGPPHQKITKVTKYHRTTLNKWRSPFYLFPPAERPGATGGEPPQRSPRGTERVGDRRGAHSVTSTSRHTTDLRNGNHTRRRRLHLGHGQHQQTWSLRLIIIVTQKMIHT